MAESYFIPAMILVATAFAGGVAMLLIGLRGRRVTDHPTCRRCRYDLHGLAEGTTACPECGADLERRRAVRKGLRVRRRGVLITGLALLMFALLPTGFYAKELYHDPEQRPTWLLMMQMRIDIGNLADNAVGVLSFRADRGALTREQSLTIFDLACKRLTPATHGILSPMQFSGYDAYVSNALNAHFVAPDRISRLIRESGGLELHAERSLDGTLHLLPVSTWPMVVGRGIDQLNIVDLTVRIDGKEVDHQSFLPPSPWPAIDLEAGLRADEWVDIPAQHSSGSQTVTVDFRVESTSVLRQVPIDDWRWIEHLSCEVPAYDGKPIEIQMHDDPAFQQAIDNAFGITITNLRSRTGRFKLYMIFASLDPVDVQSLDYAFDVYIQTQHSETLIGSFNSRPVDPFNPSPHGFDGLFEAETPGPVPKTVSVILRPSEAVANRHRLTNIYGNEIVIENVPVN